MMTQTFTFKLTDQDRQILDHLATVEGENASVLIRQMIRRAARRRGLWPPDTDTQPRQEEVQHSAR